MLFLGLDVLILADPVLTSGRFDAVRAMMFMGLFSMLASGVFAGLLTLWLSENKLIITASLASPFVSGMSIFCFKLLVKIYIQIF